MKEIDNKETINSIVKEISEIIRKEEQIFKIF